ncbi:MAG: sugar phosphate nucleotidyltransferase, partial [Endomicrobiia bacterium]|nr:sugar phosphate nucleotidyltransferase [Endomicrobiia bacterium]
MTGISGVILAGGAGARLWPRSRAYWPKFLIKFGKRSLLGECFLRLESFIPSDKIFVVTNAEHKFAVKEDIVSLSARWPQRNIISEPSSRNTLAAASVAAMRVLASSGDEPMVICPSDHLIKNNPAFASSVRAAATAAARKGSIVLFGIKPTRPDTGYGYVKTGRELWAGSRVRAASRFVEKPPPSEAAKIFKRGYLWNAGIFVVKPSILLGEIKKHNPSFYARIAPLVAEAASGVFVSDEALIKIYRTLPSVSIDYSVVEKSDRVAIMPLEIPWDDMGDWNSMRRVYKPDSNGNVFRGDVEAVGTAGTIVIGSKRLVG